jgi:hypothetical protein
VSQLGLDLVGGHHIGPLWAQPLTRAPLIHGTRLPGMRRRAAERRRTPAWADKVFMRQIWKLAQIFTEATGIQYSVDHIVPLNSPLVSGFHSHHNLEVKPLLPNLVKSNRYWPDMAEEQVELPL